jgi:hypothetical protein
MTIRRSQKQQVLKQLNSWTKSATLMRLIVSAQPSFSIFHTGCVQKLTGSDDIFYLEPNEGGGVFEFSPDGGPVFIERTEKYTVVTFGDRQTVLRLMENFADAELIAQTPSAD